ncbi:angio-associated migratory cell protein-like [Tropilaelaps mercedesae]|uniref:Angio-associated migratory cell protein-like n=1 Tax=Tropilaelaps mercedesae TaxID=418985 RepID=A0A1V9XBM3_9ACAR|nr:angio-associated migratory cell protein-like [Tropilaelaps mercedesae]
MVIEVISSRNNVDGTTVKMSGSRSPNAEEDGDFIILHSDDEDVEVIEDLGDENQGDSDEDDIEYEGQVGDEDEDMGDGYPVPVFTPSRDDALLYFKGHTDLVFIVDLSPSGNLAASGGKDDRAWLWKVEDGSPILELTGFKDSVPYIKVWNVSSKEVAFSAEVEEIAWAEWHPSTAILLAGSQDGSISMWWIPAGDVKILHSFGEATTSAKLLPDGKRLLSGYADGSIRLWDLKTCQVSTTISSLHEGEVLSIDVNSKGQIASGGADGLKFASLATGKPVSSSQEFGDCVECVAFSKNTHAWLAAGSLDGTLLVWDMNAGQQRHRIELGSQSGICRLAWAGPNHVVAASLDGKVREVDARSGEIIKEWEGHTSSLLALCVRGEKFATAAEDRSVGIFQGVVT